MVYITNALEDWITTSYAYQHIRTPQEINLARIARWYHIYIHYKEIPARYDIFGKFRCIVLDKRVPSEKQREQFFHELCHILRHAGHQSMLPDDFRKLQEWDANRFVMHASLPYFMLKKYDFENQYLIQDLANDFKVTEELCRKRMDYIKRNLFANQMIAAEKRAAYNWA